MTERLARHAALHPKRMLAIWGAIFVLSIAAIALLLPVGDHDGCDGDERP